MEIYVGDRVQIKNGAIDVTTGKTATAGIYYGEGGPLWATIDLINENWYTGNKYGLEERITKIRCIGNNNVIVWQVRPEDIADNIIRSSNNDLIQTNSSSIPITSENTPIIVETDNNSSNNKDTSYYSEEMYNSNYYAPGTTSDEWNSGLLSEKTEATGGIPTTNGVETVVGSGSTMDEKENIIYPNSNGTWRELNSQERKSIGSSSLLIDESAINGASMRTAWQNPAKRREMLSDDIENIQNGSQFPHKLSNSSGQLSARYDYQIIPGDPRYTKSIHLEDKLKQARASLGIQVHGNNNIAKAVKYYMYNRFKTPDQNLAFNKCTTHVFFTRPDLNLLYCNPFSSEVSANNQIMNHTEAAMLWKRHPELFKLLTDGNRCKDNNNFNMLLSNQVTSFQIKDEELSFIEAGKTWNDYSMMYGDTYNGRTAGEFSCTFSETNDLAIINLLKLWITYIDNVARGAWSPSYNLNGSGVSKNSSWDSHVYEKALDYAASAYVFKCGPDGEDILYWSKYYGIFPITTGASALSWNNNDPIGNSPNLNITFKYCYKRDLSPISLVEFNNLTNLKGVQSINSESSYNPNYNHSSRPYVGTPYVEMKLAYPNLVNGGVNYNRESSQIRLKFRKTSDSRLTDDLLYKRNMAI